MKENNSIIMMKIIVKNGKNDSKNCENDSKNCENDSTIVKMILIVQWRK